MENSRLVWKRVTLGSRSRVVTRRSSDDGASFGAPKPVTRDHKLLRQAANVTVVEKRPVLVVQSGALDGRPRHVYSSRYR